MTDTLSTIVHTDPETQHTYCGIVPATVDKIPDIVEVTGYYVFVTSYGSLNRLYTDVCQTKDAAELALAASLSCGDTVLYKSWS